MNTLSKDTAKELLKYLPADDAAKLGQTCKFLRDQVSKNMFIVVEQHICWGTREPGMTWEKQEQTSGQHPGYERHYRSTRENAEVLLKELQNKTNVFAVFIGLAKTIGEFEWWNCSDIILKDGEWCVKWCF